MSFKTKVRKKTNLDNRVTLQAKHNEKIKYFSDKHESLISKENQIIVLENQLKKYDNKNNNNLDTRELEKKLMLVDKLKDIRNEIDNINSKKEDIAYLLDTGNLLFDYYQNINDSSKDVKKNKVIEKIRSSKTKSVIDYFKKKSSEETKTNNTIRKGSPLKNEQKQNSGNSKYKSVSKEKMYEEYVIKIDDENISINQDENNNIELCLSCNVERKLYIADGKLICPKCGDEIFILIDSDKPSYKEPPREVCYFAYKRINHYNEWLAQFQAKESTDIPQEVYDQILIELKKERIEDMSALAPTKLREILKKLKKNKYYEHVPHIINRLNGIPPPTISREIEEELRRMFKEIQLPFFKFCPKGRKNFLSYSYVLHKFMQLLELDEFLSCFILLKSREKLHQQDQIWKKICEYLKWEFIPSV